MSAEKCSVEKGNLTAVFKKTFPFQCNYAGKYQDRSSSINNEDEGTRAICTDRDSVQSSSSNVHGCTAWYILRRWHGLNLPKQCKVRWKVPKGPRVCWACLYSVSFSSWFQVMFALQKSELHTHPMWFWWWTDAWHDRLGQYVWIILQPEHKENRRWRASFRALESFDVFSDDGFRFPKVRKTQIIRGNLSVKHRAT